MAAELREAPDAVRHQAELLAAPVAELVRRLRQRPPAVVVTCARASSAPDGALPVLAPDHPETDAVCLIQSVYAAVVRLAARFGIDPDRPRHLRKVTRTR